MEPPPGTVAGGGPDSRPVLVDVRVLQGEGAGRGEGSYARGLLGGLREEGFGDRVQLLIDADLPAPELPGDGWWTASLRRRYHGRFATYEDAAMLSEDLAGIRPGLYHSLRLTLPRRSPCPVVVTLHDLIPWSLGGSALLGERIRHLPAKRLLRRAEMVIAVSEATAADARRFAAVEPDRIRVIGEGVDAGFEPRPGARERVRERWGLMLPYLFYVGALDARKSPSDLLRAWRTANAVGAVCELVIAGTPGAQAPARLPGARLLGRVDGAELADLLNAAACLVFPSRYEGFGLPVLEAMASGCPAVAYSNSSLPEVVGSAGILVADGDAEAMGRAAARLLLDPAHREEARAAGLARAAGFTWRGAARRVIEAYGELLR